MQSKFQSNKMDFRANLLLDCILDGIFAVYEFYFFNSHGSLLSKNDKLRNFLEEVSQSGLRGPTFRVEIRSSWSFVSPDSWSGEPSADNVFVRGGPTLTINGLMDPSF